MRIMINGEPKEVAATQLEQILLECGYTKPSIATALNGTFIHRHLRVETMVQEGDRIEVVAPIEGG